MAVTQQIARVAQGILEEMSANPEVLDRLLRFKLTGPEDILDLDWAPKALLALAQDSLSEAQVRALRDLLEGSKRLNKECATGLQDDLVWSDVTCLYPSEVQHASSILAGLTSSDILRSFPPTREAQMELRGAMLPDDPVEYYAAHFTALLHFAERAADRGLGLALWWD
ncbi:hypothetical protein [Brevundimonas sp.]|uniref:hypothetical protein n=1 Tax=Brevundimonas sp. TaxID=1871086 RepID=UPI002D2CCABE|nr:hypothetical protein [Brevundimonas sp.]HYC96862.1 hypothetical protein [Brevundimonas sp.]